jgi:hypothetical protein
MLGGVLRPGISEVHVTQHQSENKETNGLGAIMLFVMPVMVAVLTAVIAYLGYDVAGKLH